MKPELLRKNLFFKASSFDDENYIVRGVFSTGGEDRHGEVIDQKGWKLDEYMLNPVILLFHDHQEFPVAKCIELGLNTDGNLAGAIQFAVNEYEVAKTAFALYKGGFMRAFSVGFMNDRYEVDQENDRIILLENRLYEISCVNVPANSMALAIAKGIDCTPLKEAILKAAEKKTVIEKKDEPEITATNKETIRSAIKTLTAVLNEESETDNQDGVKVEHPAKAKANAGGNKKIAVKTLNTAIRQLLKAKQSLVK